MAKSATDDTKSTADDSATQTSAEQGKDTPEAKSDAGKGDAKAQGDKGEESSLDHDKAPLAISIKTFLKVSGHKPDQAAGFASFAAREKPGRLPQKEWEQAYSDFYAKPLR